MTNEKINKKIETKKESNSVSWFLFSKNVLAIYL